MKAGVLILILTGVIAILPGICDTDTSASGTKVTRGIPVRITRPFTLQKILRITTGKNITNAVPSTSEADRSQREIPLLTNTATRAAEPSQQTRRTRGGGRTRFIDIDGDGIADDRDL